MNFKEIKIDSMSTTEKEELKNQCLKILALLSKDGDTSKNERSFKVSSKACSSCGRPF